MIKRDNIFFVNGVALVELLNSLDSRNSELAIDAYFIFMIRTTTRKAGKPRFYVVLLFFIDSRLSAKGEVNFY